MAITRTPMIDDDGSGTTGTIINNAWKQELYGQIDGLIGDRIPWTPIDSSGAALALPTAQGFYVVHNKMLTFWGWVIYPTTSDVTPAAIGGLPFPAASIYAGGHLTYGIYTAFFLPLGQSALTLFNAQGLPHTNVVLSGLQLIFQGAYLI